MSAREIAIAVFLGLGVVTVLLSVAGVLVMRNSFDRLHYLGPATILGSLAVTAALLVSEADASTKIKGVLIALALLTSGPIVTHATARAAWTRQRGQWPAEGSENP